MPELEKVWMLHESGYGKPSEVGEDIRKLWTQWELSNEECFPVTISDLRHRMHEGNGDETKYMHLIDYLRYCEVGDTEVVYIRYWW